MGRCITATCTSDADCDGGFCASTIEGDPGCGSAIFACTTPADECGGYSDCEDGQGCTLVDGVRECVEYSCAIGRPFLIAGAERVAPLAWRDDWLAEAPAPCLDGLGEAEQAALAEHWARAGLMEHASVAAFARFALQLLALGAPADLVRDTQAAMGDEIEHARLCFAMSRAYGGRAVGPGRLAIEGALEHRDLAAIVGDVILEGCIGETVAAIEAAEASSRATDPLVAKTLARIAEDETRHAELAWRFVRWALAGDATLHGEVARIFRPAIEAGTGEEVTKDDEAWLALGRVTGPMHRSLRAAALRGVIAPCARALLGGGRSAALAGVVDRADV